MTLAAGSLAPDFTLDSTEGALSLHELRGEKVVLYFYPKDDTPGCTQEACEFRDAFKRLENQGAVVLGVSKDTLDSHNRFRGKHGLPFTLLTDADNAVAKSYGAYGEKMMYGKRILGTIRSTFLIDAEGKVVRVWSPVKVAGHVDSVLAALEGKAEPVAKPKVVAKSKSKPKSKPKPKLKPKLKAKRAPKARRAKAR
jgi:peroxiredoxin Q/BCP